MAEYILPNGATLTTVVNEFIRHVARVEVDARAAKYVDILVHLERNWIDNGYWNSNTEDVELRPCMTYDKTTNTFITQSRFWTNLKPDISPYLCAWVDSMARNSRGYLALLGTIAHHFYQSNPRTRCCTLGWIIAIVGAGRVIKNIPDIYALTEWLSILPPVGIDRDVVFDLLNEEEFYTYDNR